MEQKKSNDIMYSHTTSHGKVISTSSKCKETIHDVPSDQKNFCSTKENISSNVNLPKNKNESNKKKCISGKNKVKALNSSCSNGNGSNYTNNKTPLQSRKGNTDNNNIKTFKNQNFNEYKYSQKSYSNNSKPNSATQFLSSKTTEPPSNYTSNISVTPITLSNNIYADGRNNFYFTSFNQGHIGNPVLYQPQLSNHPILNIGPNQCCQQVHLESWNPNPNTVHFYQQGQNRDSESITNNAKNLNSHLMNNITPTNVPKVYSNFKQQMIPTNNFAARTKSVNGNGYALNPDVKYTPSISCSNQHNNRVKGHQNYHNLTYVVTEKENLIVPANENKIQESSTSVNLIVTNDIITSNKVSETKIKNEESNSAIGSKINKNHEILKKDASFSKNSTPTGYESDSSHSSCTKKSFDHLVHNEPPCPSITQVFPNYMVTAPIENDLYKCDMHMNNYALLQQNFAYFNTKANCNMINTCSPHKYLHQTEPSTIYMNDNVTLLQSPKRIQKKYLHGKRHWFPTFKSFHIPENTPPDRFLAKSHLMEIKVRPKNLLNGSEWDKLSSDIWHKFSAHQQKEVTYRKKIYLWKYLYLSIKRNFPRYGLYLVGSTITGFGTNCSDVDMCLVHRASFSLDSRFEAISHLNNIKEYLKTLEIFEQFHLIEAKVPILRFCDSNNSLEVDLNFNNSVGIRNTHLLYCYAQLDWRLRPLALTIKLWASYHNINNAKTMTISSYSLVLMVIHFLQFGVNPPVLPCLHEMYPEKFNIILTSSEFGFVDMIEEIRPYRSENTKSLGELFLLFLEYYSNFNYSTYAISVRTGKLLPIEECRNAQSLKNDIHQWKELCIEEPFDLTNTARSVYDFETFDKIKNVFSMSWKILQSTLELNCIFTPLYNVHETHSSS